MATPLSARTAKRGTPASGPLPSGLSGEGGWHPLGAQHGRLTPLPSSGLESVDHYPILVAVTGILVRLLVHGPAAG